VSLSILNIQLCLDGKDGAALAQEVAKTSGNRQEALAAVVGLLQGVGIHSLGRLTVDIEDATNHTKGTATNTIAQASLVATTDTLTIGHTTLTWVVASANENQITIGGTDAICATNCAAIINAHSVLKHLVSASAAAAVVTITALHAGLRGRALALQEVGNGQTLSAGSLGGSTTASQSVPVEFTFGIA